MKHFLSEDRIKYYDDYLSAEIFKKIAPSLKSIPGVDNLMMTSTAEGLETEKGLNFLCRLFECVKPELNKVLSQRIEDRKFIDDRVKALYQTNLKLKNDYFSTDYLSIMGLEDARGRKVIGPLREDYCVLEEGSVADKVAPIPEYLQGNHVTLFGPPDTKKMAINAMNAYHRQLKDEPTIIDELLSACQEFPKWGADDEDSKTPMHADLVAAGENLTNCFTGEIKVDDDTSGKYQLKSEKLALPIKRFPGLALPSFFMFHKDQPIPLHLYDFALHLFANWNSKEALVFYVPKLENEEEARYIKNMIESAETLLKEEYPDYEMGTVRLMIVLENPRAVFRVNEIMDELYPYFAGASLGWHDYLGSAARLFKEDPNYRIPVKADPDIVIKYIKGSHDLLANVVGPRGGIKVGGMYGILPLDNDRWGESFQATLKGFFRDVITQMKRDLTGYWVAHPDFVRIGMSIVEAWKKYSAGDERPMSLLIEGLLKKDYQDEINAFIKGEDIVGLDPKHPLYGRSLIVADVGESNIIQNNDPEEIRYNVFQSLQYITDWLTGNGCVALPAIVAGIPVRVMDDLATAERSRWEVWHEIYHNRFSMQDFIKIAFEELNFIRRDLSNDTKIVQVKWTAENAKWYPVAFQLMIKLMTDENPVEFATELLLPFTLKNIQDSPEPWKAIQELDQDKYSIASEVERFMYYFEMCGEMGFAQAMANDLVFEESKAEQIIKSFDKEGILSAASFHGDIGKKKNLDAMAENEQAKVSQEDDATAEILKLADKYIEKFGMKFLISAQGKTSAEMLTVLQQRYENTLAEEIENAREALFEITLKRINQHPFNQVKKKAEELLKKHKIMGAQLAVSMPGAKTQLINFGQTEVGKNILAQTQFEIASLSKTIGTCLALEVLSKYDIDENNLVQELLDKYQSPLKFEGEHVSSLRIKHLVSHSALNMHYVSGISKSHSMPKIAELLNGNDEHGYEKIKILNAPGTKFNYSGAGFMVMEHLLELITGKSVLELSKPFFEKLKLNSMTFDHQGCDGFTQVDGFHKTDQKIDGDRLQFPSFAAGAYANAADMQKFLKQLTYSFHHQDGKISNDVANKMLFDRAAHSNLGSMEFMGAKVGLGLFIVEANENRFLLHQGANDGFRAIYLHCYDGPDQGKGFTILCHGDLNGVLFTAELAQEVLRQLDIDGVDTSYFDNMNKEFSSENIAQEEVVNQGYYHYLFKAFAPCLPAPIERSLDVDPLLKQSLLLAADIESVSNQRFARSENIFSPYPPEFDPELFCAQGKVMDSWESARHNPFAFDEMIFSAKEEIQVGALYLSSKFHLGNQSETVSVDYFFDDKWFEFIPTTQMDGHSFRKIKLKKIIKAQRFRLRMAPDGGFSRLAFFDQGDDTFSELLNSKCTMYKDEIPVPLKPLSLPIPHSPEVIHKNLKAIATGETFDNACLSYGAEVLEASNEHYGPASQLISPTPPIHMFDGLESARTRDEGHFEYVIIKLAKKLPIESIVLDFSFFVNNNPVAISIEGRSSVDGDWVEVCSYKEVKYYAGNSCQLNITSKEAMQTLRLKTFPDGGVNRMHVYSQMQHG